MTTFTEAPGSGDALAAAPRALIVTIYGLYAREAGGWLSVAALIRLMAGLGADEPAVRSSISRLKQRGVLEPDRRDGAAGYALSALGRGILAEGDRRIFDRPRARPGDGWLLAVFSVPEQQRRRRHTLRSRLTWLGFGTVFAGVWIAPGHLAGETAEVLERSGLAGYVNLFRAEYLAFGDVREQVGRWWDLDRLQQLYQAFLDSAGPVLERWDGRGRPRRGTGGPGLRRLRQGAHRLAAAAVPRSRPAPRTAASRVERAAGGCRVQDPEGPAVRSGARPRARGHRRLA